MTNEKILLSVLTTKVKNMVYLLMKGSPYPRVRNNAKNIELDLSFVPAEKLKGWTNNTTIFAASPIEMLLGLVLHEIGHLLYTYFSGLKLLYEDLTVKRELNTTLLTDELLKNEEVLNLFNDQILSDKNKTMYFFNSFKNFSNIVEDSFLERELLRKYNNKFTDSLKILRQYSWDNHFNYLSDLNDYLSNNFATKLKVMYSLFLAYGKYGDLKYKDKTELNFDFVQEFDNIHEEYLILVKTFGAKKRFQKTLEFYLLYVLPLLLEEVQEVEENEEKRNTSEERSQPGENGESLEEATQGNSSKAFGEPQGDEESSDELDDEDGTYNGEVIQDKDLKAGSSTDSEKEDDANDSESNTDNEDDIQDNKDLSKSIKEMEDFIESINSLAKTEEENQAKTKEKEYRESDDFIAKEIVSKTFSHKRVKHTIYEMKESQREYDNVYKKLEPNIKKVTNKLKFIFNNLQQNYVKKGLWYGGRLNFRTVHRKDIGNYERKIYSEPKAELAVCLLIDESGSMRSDSRYIHAARTAIFLEAICRELNIPVAVYGHDADHPYDYSVGIYKYRDFDLKAQEFKSLVQVSPRSCNRDGYALRFCLEKLNKRTEERKMLIIISDGQPSATGYGFSGAKADIQDALNIYSSINVFAAAIGSDLTNIESIYGSHRFLDCTDHEKLGDDLVKLLKQKIMK